MQRKMFWMQKTVWKNSRTSLLTTANINSLQGVLRLATYVVMTCCIKPFKMQRIELKSTPQSRCSILLPMGYTDLINIQWNVNCALHQTPLLRLYRMHFSFFCAAFPQNCPILCSTFCCAFYHFEIVWPFLSPLPLALMSAGEDRGWI